MGEAEREWLVARLITAEQDERRRLSVALHDGPLQSLSGVALMQDAALAAIRDGRAAEAAQLLVAAVERERAIIQELRDLSFAIEPVVLRDADLEVAVRQLGDQLQRAKEIDVDVDVAAAASLGEKSQVALYQLLREALSQAADRRPTRVSIGVRQAPDGAFAASVADDGVAERRRASVEALEERARLLGAVVQVAADERGTAVAIAIPRHAAER